MVKTGKCMVPGCLNKFNELQRRNMSYFQVPDGSRNPKKMHMAKLWLKFCGMEDNKFVFGDKSKIICEKHFVPEDLEDADHLGAASTRYKPKRVKFGAYPKIFNISHHGTEQDTPHTTDMRDTCHIQRSYGKSREELRIKTKEFYEEEEIEGREETPMEDGSQGELSLSAERYLNDFVPDPLDKPPTVERKEAADLARWPPDIQISTTDIKHILTCGICNSYFYKATTITECLHTFCKGCLVNHFYRSLHCPTCDVLVHPSDPFACIKSDTILQDIVYKIFPGRLLADKKAEIDFYTSRGLNPPDSKTPDSVPAIIPETEKVKLISLRLDYAGTTKSLPPHPPLEKNFLRIPNNVTIGQIIKFLHLKMQLPAGSQAALFINCFMLNEALTVNRLEDIFREQVHDQYSDLLFLQFGVIPKANYFDKGLLVSTKSL